MKNIFFFLFFSCFAVQAQIGGENDFYFHGAYNYGSVLVQSYKVNTVSSKNINGFELNYIKPATGKKLWQHENNFPERGFGFTYYNLNNPKVLGDIYASYIFCDIPLNKKQKPFRLYMRLASGIAYAPVHFNSINNPNNDMLSVPINGYANLKWYFKWSLGTHLCWDLGFSYSHVSNGNSNLPNLGENMLTINTGLVYKFKNPVKKIITKIDSGTQIKSKYEILLWAGIGRVQEKVFGKKYQSQSYSATYYYNIRNTNKIGTGIDVFYNPGNIQLLNDEGITLSNNLQNIQMGVKVTYTYNLGRLSLPAEIGYYVISKYRDKSSIYQRIGIRYCFKNNIVALITLKTYWIGAYNLEFGIGYRIGMKS